MVVEAHISKKRKGRVTDELLHQGLDVEADVSPIHGDDEGSSYERKKQDTLKVGDRFFVLLPSAFISKSAAVAHLIVCFSLPIVLFFCFFKKSNVVEVAKFGYLS